MPLSNYHQGLFFSVKRSVTEAETYEPEQIGILSNEFKPSSCCLVLVVPLCPLTPVPCPLSPPLFLLAENLTDSTALGNGEWEVQCACRLSLPLHICPSPCQLTLSSSAVHLHCNDHWRAILPPCSSLWWACVYIHLLYIVTAGMWYPTGSHSLFPPFHSLIWELESTADLASSLLSGRSSRIRINTMVASIKITFWTKILMLSDLRVGPQTIFNSDVYIRLNLLFINLLFPIKINLNTL